MRETVLEEGANLEAVLGAGSMEKSLREEEDEDIEAEID